ncbi:DUF3576 domain-containing protein [Sphingomonas sp. ASV193]|uniref:DUF3576 domain-containing protein n=1 Tax=Sphingomonas sp. ASV193 TaxID=3144405 RepID=UPI0032E8FCC3
MSRFKIATAAVGLAALAAGGCARHSNAPTPLASARMTSIGVNAYLWRAALDTLSFAPLASSDSNGGVIITDWYSSPNNPNERARITATILDQTLRADALRVAAVRQVNQGGSWVNAPVSAATTQKLEDIILTRARELRRTTLIK